MSKKQHEDEAGKGLYLIALSSATAFAILPVLFGSALMRASASVTMAGVAPFLILTTLLLERGITILLRSRRK